MAARTQALGYDIHKTVIGDGKKGALSFEISGVKKELVDHFSTRSQQVEAALEQRGKDRESATAREKEVAALSTRKVKSGGDREVLRGQWKAEASQFQNLAGMVNDTKFLAKHDGYKNDFFKDHRLNDANEALNYAVKKLSEREMSFRKSDLLEEARNKAFGSFASEKDLQAALSRVVDRGELQKRVVGDRWDSRKAVDGFTTKENIDIEAKMITQASLGKDKYTAMMNDAEAKKFVAKASSKGPYKWSDDQMKTTAALLSSRDQLMAIQGAAGAAKTTTVIKTFVAEAHRRGYEVSGMAPSGAASKQLQEGGGLNSKTVAKFLIDLKRQEGEVNKQLKQLKYQTKEAEYLREKAKKPRWEPSMAKSLFKGYFIKEMIGNRWRKANMVDSMVHHAINFVYKRIQEWKANSAQLKANDANKSLENMINAKRIWVVDEAGMVGTRQMHELLKATHKWNAKVIFVGDTKQLASVESGRAFHQMQSVMQTYKLETIVRQNNSKDLHDAVYSSYLDRADVSVEIIKEKMKNVREIDSHVMDRYRAVAHEYMSLSKADRDKTLVLDPSRSGRNAINQIIRDELKKEGTVRGTEFGGDRHIEKGLTKAESMLAENYHKGEVVKFQRNYKGMGAKKDVTYVVEKIDRLNNVVHLRSSSGETVIWNPAKHNKADTFQRESGGVAAGDRVIWTKNDKERDMMNSDKATVLSIDGSMATMRSDAGKQFNVNLDKWNHWDLAYAQTVHSSQSRTSENVIAHMESDRANLVNQRSMYVAISRAKDKAIIVTDDAEKLKAAVYNRSGENSIAGHETGKGAEWDWDWGFKEENYAHKDIHVSKEDFDFLVGNKSQRDHAGDENKEKDSASKNESAKISQDDLDLLLGKKASKADSKEELVGKQDQADNNRRSQPSLGR